MFLKCFNDKDTCTASMDRCSTDTVSGARRNLNRVEPKASGSLWISPAKKNFKLTYIKKNHNYWQQKQLFHLHSIRVQDSFFIFLNIKYYIHMYCDFINIHWKQIFKDFVLKFSHEIKCSLKKNVWQQIFIESTIVHEFKKRILKTEFR